MARLKHEFWLFCKAQLTAQAASVVDFCVSLLLTELFGLWYLYSTIVGAVCGGITNCVMNYRWVFHAEGMQKKQVARKYLLVWVGSILLNTAGTYILTECSGQYFAYAKIIVAVLVAFLWNYQMQRFFVYQPTHILSKLKRQKKDNENL